jgi:iron complex transport system substrate-binding protein
MKTKKKMIAIVEIAIVLCSLFLVAIPAVAAEQTTQEMSANTITTASEDDYVLGIYGNANEDDTIDMGDVVYTKLAIFGKKSKTELCDAKYDGRINVLDVIQTKLIILGKEKEITVVDSADCIVTVKKPVERLVVTWRGQLEMVRSLKMEKYRIVGVESRIQKEDYITDVLRN